MFSDFQPGSGDTRRDEPRRDRLSVRWVRTASPVSQAAGAPAAVMTHAVELPSWRWYADAVGDHAHRG